LAKYVLSLISIWSTISIKPYMTITKTIFLGCEISDSNNGVAKDSSWASGSPTL